MFEYTRRVEFRDTDTAGIVHFSVYFTYVEEAEHALLRSLGTSVHVEDEAGVWSWPRVAAECSYVGAAAFEDVLAIRLAIKRLGSTAVTYAFRCQRGDELLAHGTMTSVYCLFRPGQAAAKQPIPPELRRKLAEYQVTPDDS